MRILLAPLQKLGFLSQEVKDETNSPKKDYVLKSSYQEEIESISLDDNNEYTIDQFHSSAKATKTYYDGEDHVATLVIDHDKCILQTFTSKQINIFIDIAMQQCVVNAMGPVCIDSKFAVAKRLEVTAKSVCFVKKLEAQHAEVVLAANADVIFLDGVNAQQLSINSHKIKFSGESVISDKSNIFTKYFMIGNSSTVTTIFSKGEFNIHSKWCLLQGDTQVNLLHSSPSGKSRFEVGKKLIMHQRTLFELSESKLAARKIENNGELSLIRSDFQARGMINTGAFVAKESDVQVSSLISQSEVAQTKINSSKVKCAKFICKQGSVSFENVKYEGYDFGVVEGSLEISKQSQFKVKSQFGIEAVAKTKCDKSSLYLNKAIILSQNASIRRCDMRGDVILFDGAVDIVASKFQATHLSVTSGKSYLKRSQIKSETLVLSGESGGKELVLRRCVVKVKKLEENSNVKLIESVIQGVDDSHSTHLIRGNFKLDKSQFVSAGEVFLNPGSKVDLADFSSVQASVYYSKAETVVNQSEVLTHDLFQLGGSLWAMSGKVKVSNNFSLFDGSASFSDRSSLVVNDKFISYGKTWFENSNLLTKTLFIKGRFNLREKSGVKVSESLDGLLSTTLWIDDSLLETKKMDYPSQIIVRNALLRVEEQIRLPVVSNIMLMGNFGIQVKEGCFNGDVEASSLNPERCKGTLQDPNQPGPVLQIKAENQLTFGKWLDMHGGLNLFADAQYLKQLGHIDVDKRCDLKGAKFNNQGSVTAPDLAIGFDKYGINWGTLAGDRVTIQSNLFNILGDIWAKERLTQTGFINLNILGLVAANNYSSSSLLSANLGLWTPNFAADYKYIFTLSNGLFALRTVGSAFAPHYAPLIGLGTMGVSLVMMIPCLYKQYKHSSFDFKNLRMHEVMSGICQAKNLALFGYSIASYSRGLFAGWPASPDFSTLFSSHHCLETTGMLVGGLAGGVYDTSLLHLNMGAELEFSSSAFDLAYVNTGLDTSLFFHNVNTQYFDNAGLAAALSTSTLAQQVDNSGFMIGFENTHLEAKTMHNSGVFNGSGASVNVDQLQQQGEFSLSDGSGMIHHITDTSASSTHLSHMQVKADDADLTGHLALVNRTNVQVSDLHLEHGAAETLDASNIKAEHLVDESQLQYKGTSAIIADDLDHTGHISQLDDTESTVIIEAKTAELDGSAEIKQGIVSIDHYTKGEELIDGTGSAAKYKFDKSLAYSTKDDVTLTHDIHRQCDITVEGKSVDVAVADKRGKALGFISTDGDVTLESDLDTSSLGVKSAKDIKMNHRLAAKTRIDMEAKGECYGLGADIDTDTLTIKAKEIHNITAGSAEAKVDHGLSVGGGGNIHARDKYLLEATDGDVVNHGGKITAGKYGQVIASGDVLNLANVETVTGNQSNVKHQYIYDKQGNKLGDFATLWNGQQVSSTPHKVYHPGIISGGDGSETKGVGLYVAAGGKVHADASAFRSDADNYISGKKGLDFDYQSESYVSKREHHESGYFVTKTEDITETSTTVACSSVTTAHGRNILETAEGKVVAYGSVFAASGGTDVHAKKGMKLNAVTATHTREVKTRDWWGLSKHDKDETSQTTTSTVFDDNDDTCLRTDEGDIDASGAKFIGRGGLKMQTKGKVIFSTTKSTNTVHQLDDSFSIGVGINVQETNTQLSIAATMTEVETRALLQTRGSEGVDRGGNVSIEAGKGVVLRNGAHIRSGGDIDIDAPEIKAESAQLKSSAEATSTQEGFDITHKKVNVGVDHQHSKTEGVTNQNALISGEHISLHHGEEAVDKVELDGADIVSKTIDGKINHLTIHDRQDTSTSTNGTIGVDTAGKVSFYKGDGHSAIVQQHSGIYAKDGQGADHHELIVGDAEMHGGKVLIGGEEKLHCDHIKTTSVTDVNTYDGIGASVDLSGKGKSATGLPTYDQPPTVGVQIDHVNNHISHSPVVEGPAGQIDIHAIEGGLESKGDLTGSTALKKGTHISAIVPIVIGPTETVDVKVETAQQRSFEAQLDAAIATKLNEPGAVSMQSASGRSSAAEKPLAADQSVLGQAPTLFNTRGANRSAPSFIEGQAALAESGYGGIEAEADVLLYQQMSSLDASVEVKPDSQHAQPASPAHTVALGYGDDIGNANVYLENSMAEWSMSDPEPNQQAVGFPVRFQDDQPVGSRIVECTYDAKTGEVGHKTEFELGLERSESLKPSRAAQLLKPISDIAASPVGIRIFGAGKMAGGLLEAAVGATAVAGSDGLFMALGGVAVGHGLDLANSGFQQMWTGKYTEDYTEREVEAITGSHDAAVAVDSGISIVDNVSGFTSFFGRFFRAGSAEAGEAVPELGRPFRIEHPEYPANPEMVEYMNKLPVKNTQLDCSEIVDRLYNFGGGVGSKLRITPKIEFDQVKVPEEIDGKVQAAEYDYHYVYQEQGYIYDPRVSTSAIPKGDYFKLVKKYNPSGISLEEEVDNAMGINYRKMKP